MKCKERKILILIPFALMLFFFLAVRPIVLYDTDDWTYISFNRTPFPAWGAWNPARILPETMMTFISFVGIKGLGVFGVSLPQALIMINAVVFSLLIAYYVFLLSVHSDRQCVDGRFAYVNRILLTVIILLLHFFVFKVGKSDNEHMFWAHNMTCYYFYLLSSVTNGIVVLLLERNKVNGSAMNLGKYALLIYMAIFSNLFSNVILMAYTVVKLFISINQEIRSHHKLMRCVENNAFYLFLAILWIICAIFEVNGARSQSIASGFTMEIAESIKTMFRFYKENVNRAFLVMTALCVIINLIYCDSRKQTIEILFAFLLTNLYLILLTSVAGPGYLSRADVQFAPFFYLIMVDGICIGSLLQKKQEAGAGICALAAYFILFTCMNGDGIAYKNCCTGNLNYKDCLAVDDFIIQSVQAADRNGDTSVDILVPIKSNSNDNYPHADYGGARIADTLFRYGYTHTKMTVNLIPDQWANDKFKIYY